MDRQVFAYHLVLVYYWTMVVYYLVSPVNAYDINEKVEWHAAETYAKVSALVDHTDQKIIDILNDEIQHAQELHVAMESIK